MWYIITDIFCPKRRTWNRVRSCENEVLPIGNMHLYMFKHVKRKIVKIQLNLGTHNLTKNHRGSSQNICPLKFNSSLFYIYMLSTTPQTLLTSTTFITFPAFNDRSSKQNTFSFALQHSHAARHIVHWVAKSIATNMADVITTLHASNFIFIADAL
jgi:hypothetical protein